MGKSDDSQNETNTSQSTTEGPKTESKKASGAFTELSDDSLDFGSPSPTKQLGDHGYPVATEEDIKKFIETPSGDEMPTGTQDSTTNSARRSGRMRLKKVIFSPPGHEPKKTKKSVSENRGGLKIVTDEKGNEYYQYEVDYRSQNEPKYHL